MNPLVYILITIVCLLNFSVHAQTPYDSFAPETSRSMLGLDDLRAIEASMPSKTQTDTMLCVVVIDMQAQRLLLIDVVCGDVIAVAPLTDDMSKWLSVDPMSDKYPGVSPYAYCGWNPIRFVDLYGRDIYTFDCDGYFTGNVIKQDGDHIGRIYLSEDNYMDFSFNDQADAQRICTVYSEKYFSFSGKIDDNAITHVFFVSNEQINNILPQQTSQPSSLFGAIKFAYSQSRKGELDFVNQPSSFLQTNANALFLPTDGLNVVYNSFDFGNYLWGQSMQRLNIPLRLSLFGANVDNLFHHWPPQLDSKADQWAIINGYMYNMR